MNIIEYGVNCIFNRKHQFQLTEKLKKFNIILTFSQMMQNLTMVIISYLNHFLVYHPHQQLIDKAKIMKRM